MFRLQTLIILSMITAIFACNSGNSLLSVGPYTFPAGSNVHEDMYHKKHMAAVFVPWSIGSQNFEPNTLIYFHDSGEIICSFPIPELRSDQVFLFEEYPGGLYHAFTSAILGKNYEIHGIPCKGGEMVNFNVKTGLLQSCTLSKDFQTDTGIIPMESIIRRSEKGTFYMAGRILNTSEEIWGINFPKGVNITYESNGSIIRIYVNNEEGVVIDNVHYPHLSSFRLDSTGTIVKENIRDIATPKSYLPPDYPHPQGN